MYSALRANMWLFRLLAILSFVGGIILFLIALITPHSDILFGFLAMIGGFVGSAIWYGTAELFEVVLDTKEETEQILSILKKLRSK